LIVPRESTRVYGIRHPASDIQHPRGDRKRSERGDEKEERRIDPKFKIQMSAGPSGAGNDEHGKSVEETEELFNMGVACIKTGALDMALDIFAQVLRSRIARYGELAPECASSYCRYGAVLLYQAQDSADVFGSNLDTDVHQDVEDKENDKTAKDPTPPASSGAVDADAELAAALAAEEDGQEGEEIEATDLEVSWENLDCARAIWEKDPQTNANELASVHVLLGDVAQENEAFEDSLTDYQQALLYQKMAGYEEGDRRTAEVYFKRVMALQFLEKPEEALLDVDNAKRILEKRLEIIKKDASGSGGGSNEDAAAEAQDVEAILEDLKEKKVELEALAEEKRAMAEAVRGALSKMTQQQGAQGDNSLAPAGNKSNITSPVKDLGVVGRGTKRIKLEPTAVEPKKEEAAAGEAEAEADGKGGGDVKTEAKVEANVATKRNLDDMMGGGDGNGGNGGGETTIGF
jgi:HAT1-interacting factor 1